jgi:hypothetical protein
MIIKVKMSKKSKSAEKGDLIALYKNGKGYVARHSRRRAKISGEDR